MGGYKGNADGITLSDQFVFPSAFPATFKYPLRQAAGAEVNFGGFNQFRLFERDTNTLIAVADMPAKTGSGNGNNTSGALTSSVLGAALLSLTWAFAF